MNLIRLYRDLRGYGFSRRKILALIVASTREAGLLRDWYRLNRMGMWPGTGTKDTTPEERYQHLAQSAVSGLHANHVTGYFTPAMGIYSPGHVLGTASNVDCPHSDCTLARRRVLALE